MADLAWAGWRRRLGERHSWGEFPFRKAGSAAGDYDPKIRTGMTSAIESVTVGVRDLEAALRLFRTALGWRLESDTRASVSLLGAWHHAVHADVRLVELSCDGHPFGRLRLARYAAVPSITTRLESGDATLDRPTDIGPKTLDLLTGAPYERAVSALNAAGSAPRSPVIRYKLGATSIEERVFDGPEGMPILLTLAQPGAGTATRTGPPAGRSSEITRVSMITADLDASRRFYSEGLELICEGGDAELDGDMRDAACQIAGVPPGTRMQVAVVRDRQQSSGRILLVRFLDGPQRLLRHPMSPGQLGFNLFSLRCADLDALETRLRALDAEITTRPTHVGLGDGVPARVMLVRGPNRELLEFIEREQ